MTDRIRIRRPWLAVLTPSAAAVFSTLLVWATGHDAGAVSLATAATTAGSASSASAAPPSALPTQSEAGVTRQIAAQEAELRRLAAQVRALRSALPRGGHPGSAPPSTATTTPARTTSAVPPRPGGTTPAPPRPAPATRTARPTLAPAPVHTSVPPAAPPPPPVPTPHVTTRSS